MGKVTEELVGLIAKQVQDHGLVVWYDPEQAYSDVVDQFNLLPPSLPSRPSRGPRSGKPLRPQRHAS